MSKSSKKQGPDIVLRKDNGKEVSIDLDPKEWLIIAIIIIALGSIYMMVGR